MENILEKIIAEVNTYLEDKYNKNFKLENIASDDGNPAFPNKAYVHPEGLKNERFAVRIDYDENTGERSYSDGYGFVMAEQVLLPSYQAWVDEVIPGSKITVYIENDTEVTIGDYSAGFSLDEFIEAESPYAIKMSVIAGSELLSDKTLLFTEMSLSIDEKLDRTLCYKIVFAFTNENPDSIEISKYRGASTFIFKLEPEKFVALTEVFIIEEMSQSDISKELEDEFTDDMELESFDLDLEDEEDGE